MKTIKASSIHAESMRNDPEYRAGYDSLEEEFALIDTLLRARKRARLTQAEVASRMGTTESAVSRLESGRARGRWASMRRRRGIAWRSGWSW